jgi:hypothetical protein
MVIVTMSAIEGVRWRESHGTEREEGQTMRAQVTSQQEGECRCAVSFHYTLLQSQLSTHARTIHSTTPAGSEEEIGVRGGDGAASSPSTEEAEDKKRERE